MKLTGVLATSVITALALGPGYSAQVQAPRPRQIQNPTEMRIAGDPKEVHLKNIRQLPTPEKCRSLFLL